MSAEEFHLYLGDGVYAGEINGVINLRLGDHRSEPVVVLEPEVIDALILFAKSRGVNVANLIEDK